jgi:hypothetical protein
MTGKPDSPWPTASALIYTALLLAGLGLVAALADGWLAAWLPVALVVLWALAPSRGDAVTDTSWAPSERRALLVAILIPIFISIVVADELADGAWFVFALIAIATPLVALARAGLVLWWRRGTHRSRGAT